MKVALAADHRGYATKEKLKALLASLGHKPEDFGTQSEESCDYPDCAIPASRAVAAGECDRAMLICSSGIGVSMVANRIAGIRAALCFDEETARVSRSHNDANVLCLPASRLTWEQIEAMVKIWLEAPFEGGRHQRRIDKIMKLDQHR